MKHSATRRFLILSLALLATLSAPARAADAGGLVGALVSQLGITKEQAMGGAGLLLGSAQKEMAPGDWTQVAAAIPDLGSILGAAPDTGSAAASSSGMGAMGGHARPGRDAHGRRPRHGRPRLRLLRSRPRPVHGRAVRARDRGLRAVRGRSADGQPARDGAAVDALRRAASRSPWRLRCSFLKRPQRSPKQAIGPGGLRRLERPGRGLHGSDLAAAVTGHPPPGALEETRTGFLARPCGSASLAGEFARSEDRAPPTRRRP